MNSTRPVRKAAEIARKRIRSMVSQDEDYDTIIETAPQKSDMVVRADKNGYTESLHVIRYLLEKCEEARYEDEKSEVVEEVFRHLIHNPSILIYEPRFRAAVVDKIAEFENHIQTRTQSYKKANYHEALKIMMVSMRANIRNSKIRNAIFKQIQEIRKSLVGYEAWTSSSLKSRIGRLKVILENIKEHPEYVCCD